MDYGECDELFFDDERRDSITATAQKQPSQDQLSGTVAMGPSGFIACPPITYKLWEN
jgi:hypothetical protein